MGYVTIDASDWAIDDRLRKRLAADPMQMRHPIVPFCSSTSGKEPRFTMTSPIACSVARSSTLY